jgi:hypothetical protein
MTQVTGGGASNVPFTAYSGWNPGAVTNRALNCQVNPSTETTQDSAGLFLVIGNTATSSNNDLSGGPIGFGISVRSGGTVQSRIHAASNQTWTGNTITTGFYAVMRTASTTTRLYGPDGALMNSNNTVVSATLPVSTAWYLGSATGSITADRAIAVHGITTGLNGTEVLALRNALNTFLTNFHA